MVRGGSLQETLYFREQVEEGAMENPFVHHDKVPGLCLFSDGCAYLSGQA